MAFRSLFYPDESNSITSIVSHLIPPSLMADSALRRVDPDLGDRSRAAVLKQRIPPPTKSKRSPIGQLLLQKGME
jgi:hypothetical protein